MIIYLIQLQFCWRRVKIDIFARKTGAGRPANFHSPRCNGTRGSNGPAALPLFCLAPHGVFHASRITPRAVSSYLAFSPLPAPFSKNRRYLFCDTSPSTSAFANVARVFYAACCRMVFGLSSSKPQAARQRSSAIRGYATTKTEIRKPRSQENGAPGGRALSFFSRFPSFQIPFLILAFLIRMA